MRTTVNVAQKTGHPSAVDQKTDRLEPHDHEWSIESGTAHGHFGVFFSVYCWCGAWANQELSGAVYNVREPLPETRTRQFEKRLWDEEHRTG